MVRHVTSSEASAGGLLFLDACCLINLFGSGHIEDVLELLPYRFATSELVADHEVLTIRGAEAPDGSSERLALSPRDLEASNRLSVLPIASDQEKREYVRFAADLDDGEASVCALAVVHGGGVATDDRKALRILGGLGVQVPVFQTPELLFVWAQHSKAPESKVREALLAVGDRASFYPRKGAPRFQWWETLCSRSS